STDHSRRRVDPLLLPVRVHHFRPDRRSDDDVHAAWHRRLYRPPACHPPFYSAAEGPGRRGSMYALLDILGLSKRFGGLVALSNVAMTVEEGEVRGIIGPNGSGKSTLFNLVTGVYPADAGSLVRFRGEDITNREPHEIARRGLARTFQLLRIFAEMTVIENLMVGCHRQGWIPVAVALFGMTGGSDAAGTC